MVVTQEEIERVSKLMKIDIDDHGEYVDKVKKMIGYFDLIKMIKFIGQNKMIQCYENKSHLFSICICNDTKCL